MTSSGQINKLVSSNIFQETQPVVLVLDQSKDTRQRRWRTETLRDAQSMTLIFENNMKTSGATNTSAWLIKHHRDISGTPCRDSGPGPGPGHHHTLVM